MNRKRCRMLLVAIALAAVVLLAGCTGGGGAQPGDTQGTSQPSLQSVRFSWQGMMYMPISSYNFELRDGAWWLTLMGYEQVELSSDPLTQAQSQQLLEAVQTVDLPLWDGFDETDSRVLDGESFWLEATYDDGTTVSAHGNNSFPKGYGTFKDAVLEVAAPYEQKLFGDE